MKINITITAKTLTVAGHAENEACARVSTLCQSFAILCTALSMAETRLEYGFSEFLFHDSLTIEQQAVKDVLESCLNDLFTLYPANINLEFTKPNNFKEV